LFDPRLYRVAALLSVVAAIVLMFSVVSRPESLHSETAPDAFSGDEAALLTRQLLRIAPDRAPGGPGDRRAADYVANSFRAIEGGQVVEQRFGAEFDGNHVDLRNVTLLLPGISSQRIVIAAPRDCSAGPCAASSAAATGALLELAAAFDGARHHKSLVFVSLDGSAAGAEGARQLAGALHDEPAEAVLVISQAGSRELRAPHVVPWSSGPQSTSIQLIESAKDAVEAELSGGATLRLGTVQSLLRLAIPVGLGDQAPLIEDGADAIAVSAAGDRPLPESEDGLGQLSVQTLEGVGRATLSLTFALDESEDGLIHGPDAFVPLAGKLIPGWSLALLALTLLLPIGVVSFDALARASRHREPVLVALGWVLSRVIPFAVAMLLAYGLALVGLIPKPAFPFNPDRETLDPSGVIALLLLLGAFIAALRFDRLFGPPDNAAEALAPAIGLTIFVATLGVWLANPYLALLLVPTAHLWFVGSLLRGQLGPAIAIAAAGLVLPLLAIVYVAVQLGSGISAPWQLLLMFTGRHFGPLAAVPLCLLGGCLLAMLTVAATRPGAPSRRHPALRQSVLTQAGGSRLGGARSVLPK
jgi:hypothetical protein